MITFSYDVQEGSTEYFVFDCYLLSTCEEVSSGYVYVRYENGIDVSNCGGETNPCKNIAYALNKAPEGYEIRLLYSSANFPSVACSLPGKLFSIQGVPEVVDGELIYPQKNMDYSAYINFNFSNACRGTFCWVRLLINASANQQERWFLYQTANDNTAYMRFEIDFADCLYC
jgi:hypothetical protein